MFPVCRCGANDHLLKNLLLNFSSYLLKYSQNSEKVLIVKRVPRSAKSVSSSWFRTTTSKRPPSFRVSSRYACNHTIRSLGINLFQFQIPLSVTWIPWLYIRYRVRRWFPRGILVWISAGNEFGKIFYSFGEGWEDGNQGTDGSRRVFCNPR